MSEHGTSSATTTRAAGRIVGLLAGVVAPTTLLTGVAYYFAWRREEAFASYFGIDPALLELSTTDYLLRSVDALFAPIAVLLLAAFAALGLHALLAGRIEPVYAAPVVGVFGAVALLIALALASGNEVSTSWIPLQALGLGVGALLLAYTVAMLLRGREGAAATVLGLTYVGVALAIVSLFWATAEYADERGVRLARKLAADIEVNPQAVVLSKVDLNIDLVASGTEACPAMQLTRTKRAAYGFEYVGFTLLARSGGKYFLTPTGDGVWDVSHPIFILPDDDAIRIELIRGFSYVPEALESTFAGPQRPPFTC